MGNTFVPMSETAYLILLSLLEERHGYGIMQHVAQVTNGRINLGAGTVYGTIGKLEKAELIQMIKEEEKRKYYKISKEGRAVLKQELNRIQELCKVGEAALEDGKE